MRGRRRYRVPRRPRIPPSASIAPVAQHRGGNAQLACDPAQRPTAAHQQGYRFPLELIRKMTPSLAHSTPFRSRRSLAKVSTNSREPHRTPSMSERSRGVGRVYQQPFIDTYAKVAFAKLYDRKTPITAAEILNDRVVPFYDEHGIRLSRVLTDRGTEF